MKYFSPFRFDERAGLLSRAGEDVPLTRKAAEVLSCLVNRPGEVVSHPELTQRVWPATHVQPENIKALVRELRIALGDDSESPRFIRSEPGRGYVFVTSVTDALVPLLADAEPGSNPPPPWHDRELAVFDRHLAAAAFHGEPQLVIVEGERGFGKTTLCEGFVRHAVRLPRLRITYAQGLETSGPTKPYGVLIDAIDRLAGSTRARFGRLRQARARVGAVVAGRWRGAREQRRSTPEQRAHGAGTGGSARRFSPPRCRC